MAVTATAAVRHAKNQKSFVDEVQSACGIKLQVLSQEEEATFVYQGVINSATGRMISTGRYCYSALITPSAAILNTSRPRNGPDTSSSFWINQFCAIKIPLYILLHRHSAG